MNEENDSYTFIRYELRHSRGAEGHIAFVVYDDESRFVEVEYVGGDNAPFGLGWKKKYTKEDAREFWGQAVSEGYLLYSKDRSKAKDPIEYTPSYKESDVLKNRQSKLYGTKWQAEVYKEVCEDLYGFRKRMKEEDDGFDYALKA